MIEWCRPESPPPPPPSRITGLKSKNPDLDMWLFVVNVLISQGVQARNTHICRIKGCGSAGSPPTNNFRKT